LYKRKKAGSTTGLFWSEG